MTLGIVVLMLVTAQRLGELVWSNANARRLKALGAVEVGAGHYPAIVGVFAAWIFGLWFFGAFRSVSLPWLGMFLLLQAARAWILWTLGRRWTTRVFVLPGATLIRTGPYCFLTHPNYAVLLAEVAVLPLVFGMWIYAASFAALAAAVLAWRIRVENAALAGLR